MLRALSSLLAGSPLAGIKGQAPSAAALRDVLLCEVCRAVTWSSLQAFVRHDTLEHSAAVDTAAGTALLQAASTHHLFDCCLFIFHAWNTIGTIAGRRGGYLPATGGSSGRVVPVCIPLPASFSSAV